MNKVKFVLLALLATTLLFLASCGEHSLDDVFGDIFGVSSSSGGNGDNYSSSEISGSAGSFSAVKIGTQTWMAENLNYNVPGSKCFRNADSNCVKYGRLYDWATAMDLPASCNTSECSSQIRSKHKGICPDGWHIPSAEDWYILMGYVQTDNGGTYTSGHSASKAGIYLKTESGWNYDSGRDMSGDGYDKYGFSALPGGIIEADGRFLFLGQDGLWWSTTSEFSSDSVWGMGIYNHYDGVHRMHSNKARMYSVRCVYDCEGSDCDRGGPVIIPNDNELDSLVNETPNPSGVVEPLLKTKWGQGAPYKNMLPEQPRATFCNLVAASQIMKYHNYPTYGRGQSEAYTMTNGVTIPSVNFGQVHFDWDNMLDSYNSSGTGSTEQQRNAVASLIYYAGVGRKRDFISGSSKNSWPIVFTTYFGYDKSVQYFERVYYNDSEWEAIIKEQLDAGLPVLHNGHNQAGSNHYVVIDGYDNTGKFHINFGWSGSSDGWYSLNDMGGWNYGRSIVTNIKPNNGGMPAPYEMALTSFAASKTTVSQNELFIISSSLKNLASLDTFPGGQIGAALVDNSDNIKAIIGSRSSGVREPGWNSSGDISSFVPSIVAPGQYKLKIAIKPTDGEWKIVTRSAIGDGIPNSIPIAVTPAAEKGAPGGGYGLALTAFATNKTTVSQSELINSFATSKTIVAQNELFIVNSALKNVAQDTFPGGQIGTALVDNNGNIKAIIGSRSRNAINPGSTSSAGDAYSYVPSTIAPGQYKLRIAVKPTGSEEWRIATMSVGETPNSISITVTAGETNGDGHGLALQDFTVDKVSASRAEAFAVFVRTRTISQEAFPGGQIGAALIDNNGDIAYVRTMSWGELANNATRSNTLNCSVPNDVASGQYKLRIVVASPAGTPWKIANMSLPDVPNSIDFEVR